MAPQDLTLFEELYRQNQQILSKLNTTEPWYKTLAPFFYTVAGSLLTLLIAWRTVKWNTKKELRNDLKRLYAEFGSLAKTYSTLYHDLSFNVIQGEVLLAITSALYERVRHPMGMLEKRELDGSIEIYDKTLEHVRAEMKGRQAAWQNCRTSLLKTLYEIEFISKSPDLRKLINAIDSLKLHDFTFADNIEELMKKDYPDRATEKLILPVKLQLDQTIFETQEVIKGIKI